MAIFVGLCLLTFGCGMSKRKSGPTGPRSGKYGNEALLGSPGASSTSSTASQPAGGTTSKPGTKTSPGTSSSNTNKSSGSGASVRDIGYYGSANGRLILGGDQYKEINLEFDHVQGREPSQAAIDHLVKLLKGVAPTKTVTVNGASTIASQGGRYTSESLEAIGNTLREVRSVKPRASIWIGYLDGTLQGGGAAGVAFSGTLCAVFMDTVNELPFPPSTKLEIEKTILVQEVFHLLGLVNIGYLSPRPHEDKDHPHHSNNANSVMYWALMDKSNIINFISHGGRSPTNFDEDDLADLRDIASGKL